MSRVPIPQADPLSLPAETVRAALLAFNAVGDTIDQTVVYGGDRWPWLILGSSGEVFRIDTAIRYGNGRMQFTCSPVLLHEDTSPQVGDAIGTRIEADAS